MIIMDRHGTGISQSDAKSKQIPMDVFNAKDHGIFARHVVDTNAHVADFSLFSNESRDYSKVSARYVHIEINIAN